LSDRDLLERYNYDSFIPANFKPWSRFDVSPPLGEPGPDSSLLELDGTTGRTLGEVCAAHLYTIVEFGSFT
jgi:hypothetical protein